MEYIYKKRKEKIQAFSCVVTFAVFVDASDYISIPKNIGYDLRDLSSSGMFERRNAVSTDVNLCASKSK